MGEQVRRVWFGIAVLVGSGGMVGQASSLHVLEREASEGLPWYLIRNGDWWLIDGVIVLAVPDPGMYGWR